MWGRRGVLEEERGEREVGIGGEVNRWSWGCVGLGFGVEGGCCHWCLGSEKLWELFVSREIAMLQDKSKMEKQE